MNQGQPISPEAVAAATDVKCEKCGSVYFDQAVALKKLSQFEPENTTGQPQLIPMGMFLCRECDHPLLNLD